MVTPLIIGGAASLAAFALARASLRQAARSGRPLSPLLQRIAGTSGAGGSGELSGDWVKGGFLSKMDKSEAASILGLR